MAVIWGAALPIVKPSLNFVSPFQFLYFRYLLAAPLLLPVFIYYLFKLKPSLKTLLTITVLEFLGTAINLPILYYGLKLTSSIEASLIGAAGPVFTVLGGIIFLHEKESRREWRGLTLSFLGTLILVIEPLLTGRNHGAGFSMLGNGLVLTYNLIYVIYVLLAKVHYRKIPKLLVSSLSYPVALVSFWLLVTLMGLSTSVSLLTIPEVALASGYMAIFGSIVAWTLFLYGQSLIEASEASLFTYLQGIVAIPVAWFFLSELPTWPMAIAIFLIASGVILAEKRV
jgi:drug/metabolite transporter (DMT)-like permease